MTSTRPDGPTPRPIANSMTAILKADRVTKTYAIGDRQMAVLDDVSFAVEPGEFVVIMGTLWSVQISTDNGVRNVPPIYARAAMTMGSRGLHTWIQVILPASLPFIISGVKQGWAFAWRSLMAAEIYVTILTGYGLGHLLQYGRELAAMDQVLGVMLVIVLIGLLADKILFSPWERFLHRRWGTVKA